MYRGKRLFMGLGGSNQDFSACLVNDGEVLVAIEEERLSRKKYGISSNIQFPQCRRYCVDTVGVSMLDVDEIIATDICNRAFLLGVKDRCQLMNHHLAHAASAFYASPYEESAILVVDANGSFGQGECSDAVETVSWFVGKGTSIEKVGTIWGKDPSWDGEVPCVESKIFPSWLRGINNSLGYFYAKISSLLGFGFVKGELAFHTEDGKTMGLAAYGTDRYLSCFEYLLSLEDNGSIRIESGDTGKLESIVARILSEDTRETHEVKADIAWAAQNMLERALFHIVRHVKKLIGLSNLCIAGGVALNSLANGKIATNGIFENIFVPSAPGDSGTAIGCALFGYHNFHHESGSDRRYSLIPAGLGRSYSESQIQEVLSKFPDLIVREVDNVSQFATELLLEDKVIGWFQGSSEFGPRALGHRSILCLPRPGEIKDVLNTRVKFRESFRPFAPVILHQDVSTYFQVKIYSPYMSFVVPAKRGMVAEIAATVHVDGTSRVQTLDQAMARKLYALLQEIGKRTGIPVLLNTSFNIRGEPMVETPADAIRCFLASGCDALFMQNFIVTRVV